MKISIITTTYNCEKYIKDTLEGVLYQKGNFEIEYILFDAMSNDKTFEIIKQYEALVNQGFFKDRNSGITMKAFQEKDEGMYDGISKGFKLATGDIIAYINGDDYYMPYAFSTVSEIFSQMPEVKWLCGIVNGYNIHGQNYCRSDFCNYMPHLIYKGAHAQKLQFIQQESCFWRKEILDKVDLDKFKKYKLAGDFFLWHEFAKQGISLYNIDSILSGFRYTKSNKSSAVDDYFNEMKEIIAEEKLSKKENFECKYLSLAHKIQFDRIISNTLIQWDCNLSKWVLLKTSKKETLKKAKFNIRRSILFFILTLFYSKLKKDIK